MTPLKSLTVRENLNFSLSHKKRYWFYDGKNITMFIVCRRWSLYWIISHSCSWSDALLVPIVHKLWWQTSYSLKHNQLFQYKSLIYPQQSSYLRLLLHAPRVAANLDNLYFPQEKGHKLRNGPEMKPRRLPKPDHKLLVHYCILCKFSPNSYCYFFLILAEVG